MVNGPKRPKYIIKIITSSLPQLKLWVIPIDKPVVEKAEITSKIIFSTSKLGSIKQIKNTATQQNKIAVVANAKDLTIIPLAISRLKNYWFFS